jgi:hypothetical protein
MWFWHTTGTADSECIGTVVGSFSEQPATASRFRVRVYSNGGSKPAFSRIVPGKLVSPPFVSHETASVGVHRKFTTPVEVCGAWISSRGDAGKSLPILCQDLSATRP